MAWAEAPEAYRSAYRQAMLEAVNLPSEVAGRISVPLPLAASEGYLEQSARIMIAGQETNGVYNPLLNCQPDVDFDKYQAQVREFANGAELGSAFWRGARDACGVFGLKNHEFIWSNVARVQNILEASRTASFLELDARSRMEVVRWQKPLFLADIKAWCPDGILALTGPRYDWLWGHMIDDLVWEGVEGFPTNQLARAYSDSTGVKLVRTYHPNYSYVRRPSLRHLVREGAERLKVWLED